MRQRRLFQDQDVRSVILHRPVTASQVAQCMIGLKLVREANSHHRDNVVDIIGYAGLIEEIGQ
jgi:hypothetical protein